MMPVYVDRRPSPASKGAFAKNPPDAVVWMRACGKLGEHEWDYLVRDAAGWFAMQEGCTQW